MATLRVPPEQVYVGGDLVPYDASRYNWNETPDPADPTCRGCYRWGPYPPGQEHFGFIWWRVCEGSCPCEHHDSEVWVG